jgi:hypothetical protein
VTPTLDYQNRADTIAERRIAWLTNPITPAASIGASYLAAIFHENGDWMTLLLFPVWICGAWYVTLRILHSRAGTPAMRVELFLAVILMIYSPFALGCFDDISLLSRIRAFGLWGHKMGEERVRLFVMAGLIVAFAATQFVDWIAKKL